MTSRTRNRRVSYKEIDSASEGEDNDIEEGENDETMSTTKASGSKARGRGDTYGTAKPPKKKARRSTTKSKNFSKDDSAVPEVPSYNADLLLDLPFDMLAEVCSHLDAVDLISLAKVSKQFRKLFLSPSTRSVWTTLRRRDGYELPEGMSEIDLALFMFGTHCQLCGAANSTKLYDHGIRCFRARRDLRLRLKELHDKVFECIQGASSGFYIAADLDRVNEQLQDLEYEDEQTRSDNLKLTLWTTKSRRRSSASTGQPKEANAVDRFVEQRKAEIEKQNEDMNRLSERESKLRQQARLERGEQLRRQREEHEVRQKREGEELVAVYDWTDEQVALAQSYRGRLVIQGKPAVSPAEDIDGWRKYRDAIQVVLDVEEAERQAEPGRNARLGVLRDFLEDLQDDLDDELDYPADAQLDKDDVVKLLPVGRKALKTYADRVRIQAIQQIVAAQTGASPSTSTSSAAYPKDTYNDAFFSRITSTFLVRRISPSYGGIFGGGSTFLAKSYPACLRYRSTYSTSASFLRSSISFKQVCAIRACVKAAGADEDTVTVDEMDDFGAAFTWPLCPRKTSRGTRLNWVNMVPLIERRGPGVQRLKAGELVELSFTPPTTTERKGKAKMPATFVFSDSEDSEDDSDEDVKPVIAMDSDEEDVKPVIESDGEADELEEEEEEEDA
ncbi:hypothetical protein JCM8097_000094 [Rhodosporidiobolus ruineniae]